MVDSGWDSFQRPTDNTSDQRNGASPQGIGSASASAQSFSNENFEQRETNWGQLQTPYTFQSEDEQEGWGSYLLRNAVALPLKGIAKVGGLPGDAEQLIKYAIKKNPNAAFGNPVMWGIKELVGQENWEKAIDSIPDLPVSAESSKSIDDLTGGFTKPKSKKEKALQETAEDVTTVLATGPRGWVNVLGVPIASNGAKLMTQELGMSETKGDIVKAITWIGLNLAGMINGKVFAAKLTNEGRQGIPSNAHIDVTRLENDLNNLISKPQFVPSDPRSKLAYQQAEGILNNFRQGNTSINSMMTTYDGLNAAGRSGALFELGKADRAFSKARLNDVRTILRNEINRSAAAYPEAVKAWNNGIGAWAAIHESNAIGNFVQEIAKGSYSKILGGAATGLFGGTAASISSSPVMTGFLASVGYSLYKTGQVAHRVWNNPVLANYYGKALVAAQQGNVPLFVKYYEKLNSGLSKGEKKERVGKKIKD